MRTRLLLAALVFALPHCGDEPAQPQNDDADRLSVGVLVADGVDDLAVAAALAVFHAIEPGTTRAARVALLSEDGGSVTTRAGATLGPTRRWESEPKHDVFVLAANPRSLALHSEARNRFENECLRPARWILAAGTETFGLVQDPLAPLDGVSFVADDRVVWSMGGARTVDAALFLVERTLGETTAIDAGRALGIRWNLDRVRHIGVGDGDGPGLRVGESLPSAASVADEQGAEVRILDLARPDDRVLVVCVHGGAAALGSAAVEGGAAAPESDTGKAGLWCEDSFFEMAQVRHAMAVFAEQPVRFIGIACPPVFHEEKFGYAGGAFAATHANHAAEVKRFVDATRAARELGVLPYDALYFDPTFHLMKKDAKSPIAADGTGALRAPDESQMYGTPTLWVFDRSGKVLVPPFHGNNWEKDRELRFTARDIEDAIRVALETTRR